MSKENYDRKLIRIDNAREVLPKGITLKQRECLCNRIKNGMMISIGAGLERRSGRVVGKYPYFVLLEIQTLTNSYLESFTWAELLTSRVNYEKQ